VGFEQTLVRIIIATFIYIQYQKSGRFRKMMIMVEMVLMFVWSWCSP